MEESSQPEGAREETTRFCRRRNATATELDLREHRKMASSALNKSRQQERIYVTKKQANYGRGEAKKAKIHFRNARRNTHSGMACTWHSVCSLPAIMREKLDQWNQQRTIRQAELAQRKLDEMNVKQPAQVTETSTSPEI